MIRVCLLLTASVWAWWGSIARQVGIALSLIGLLVLPAFTGHGQGVQSQIPASEYQALLDFYQATGGTNWNTQDGWLDPQASSWYGVHIDENGSVDELGLWQNNLTGSIPGSLSALLHLKGLTLYGNLLTGDIPAELGGFSQLETLFLSDNRLTGNIPASLGNLSRLQSLGLNGNQLNGTIPASLGQLTTLTFLSLSGNQLSGDVPNFTAFHGVVMDVSRNRLDLTAGSQSMSNIAAMIAAGNDVRIDMVAQIPPSEYEALADFYQANQGQDWLKEMGWLDPQAPSWSGVWVTSGHVASLYLPYYSAWHSLPPGRSITPGLTNLTQLQALQMSGCRLQGGIPDSLGNLPQLEILGLGGNELTGGIPDSLGSLPKLKFLSLSGNRLTGSIPQSLTGLVHLERLYLGGNEFTGSIPASLGSLAQLQTLDLSSNGLSGSIPGNLGSLTQLQTLNLSSNRLTGSIPGGLGRLVHATTFDLSYNQLSGVVPSLQDFRFASLHLQENQLDLASSTTATRLRDLEAVGNSVEVGLQGQIPALEYKALTNFYNATGGTNWTVSQGWFTQASSWYGVYVSPSPDGRHVTRLDLSGNHLQGNLPVTMSLFSQLQTLNLSSNRLGGDIPSSLDRLPLLKSLNLSSNELTGVPNLGDLNGTVIDLSLNPLDLTPGSVTRSNITATTAAGNQVRAGLYLDIVPEEYQVLLDFYDATGGTNWLSQKGWLNPNASSWEGIQLTEGHVTSLNRVGQGITGSLPASLTQLSHLEFLYLSRNRLTGEIPDAFTNLVRLRYLGLAENRLEGSLPDGIGNLTNLTRLEASNNRLKGPLPESLGRLGSLNFLELAGNQFSGSIPPGLSNLTNLYTLDLSYNQLGGTIPESLGQLPLLEDLVLSHNQLIGGIPDALGRLPRLWDLSLSYNQLAGGIPEGFGPHSPVYSLALDHNHLGGDLPDLHVDYPRSRLIDISFNDFNLAPGSPSLTNVVTAIATTNYIVFSPQNGDSPPILMLSSMADQVTFSWPMAAADFALETSATLDDNAEWTQLTYPNDMSLLNRLILRFEYVLIGPEAGTFFRLRER